MPTLVERLKSLGVKVGAQDLPAPRPRISFPIEEVVSGRFIENGGGSTFLREELYPSDYLHGQVSLHYHTSLQFIADWAREQRISDLPPQAFAFLDTETSGLAGGTGTFAFLVGVGRITDQGFQLAQYFMRDPLEEPALLLALEEFLSPCQALVTFNGKTFDAPLLNTRYTLQGWHAPFEGLAHLDLLHLSRRLWRDHLSSRTLSNLEYHILGVQRSEEEVPGWMIPQIYFDYLRDGDARPLKRVFYHNAMDVVSLAGLLTHISQLLAVPSDHSHLIGVDRAAIARLFDELGHDDLADQEYQHSLNAELPADLRHDTLERLALLHKRHGDYPAAIPVWEVAANEGMVFACVELAKYYEHHSLELTQALQWTHRAIEIIQDPGFSRLERQQVLPELEHRLERLRRKIEQLSDEGPYPQPRRSN